MENHWWILMSDKMWSVCRKHYSWNSEGGSNQISLSLEELSSVLCWIFSKSVIGHFANFPSRPKSYSNKNLEHSLVMLHKPVGL